MCAPNIHEKQSCKKIYSTEGMGAISAVILEVILDLCNDIMKFQPKKSAKKVPSLSGFV